MAALTQTELEDKIATVDAAIATIITALSGSGAAAYVDYKIGDKEVTASQKLEQLRSVRKMYQEQLDLLPSEIHRAATYDVQRDGRDDSDLEGDQ